MEFTVPEYNSSIDSMEMPHPQLETYAENPPLQQFSTGSMALGQEYSHLHSILADGGNQFGVSSLTFDSPENILWMGNQGGHVTSYYESALQKYTSFQVHATNEIREILCVDAGVLSLTSNFFRLSARKGLPIFSHMSDNMQDMQCMVLRSSGNLLMGGHQPLLVEFDLNRAEETGTFDVGSNGCAIIRRHPRFICCGDTSGKITLRDPISLKAEHTLEAHSGMLSDFDVHGNLLITCGFSSRHGVLTVDRFLMVYDLRAMRSMTPIQLVFPPLLLRFVTAFTSRVCVVSQSGQFQLLDTGNNNQSHFIHQVENGAAILTFDTSASSQALAFGDAAGYIHLFGASEDVHFNAFSQPTEFPDSVEPLQQIDISDEVTPLSTIPMPHCTGKLLSDWPEEFTRFHYRCTPPIDPQILNSVKMVGPIGYAPNPGTFLRNQVPYPLENRGLNSHRDTARDDNNDSVPQRYLKLEIKYSRMGTEDTDFSRYNRTSFSGLEANLPNAYCNNMIQVLYFISPLKCALVSHLCQREFCLSCELGFLFHMLDTAQGVPCQASNFLRAFRTIPEASALGLILSDLSEARKKTNLSQLVQSWMRFMLQQIHSELVDSNENANAQKEASSESASDTQSTIISELFGAQLLSNNHWRCGIESVQESTTLLCSLVYPDCTPVGKPPIQFTFEEVLKNSLVVEQNVPAWCEKCEKYQVMHQLKKLKTLPDILVISCGLENQQDITFWKLQMELLNNMEGSNVLKSLPDMPLASRRPCRYGSSCTRSDCKFLHVNGHNANPSSQESVTSWLPTFLKIKRDPETEDIKVEKITSNIATDKQARESSSICIDDEYELTAIISVVLDPKESGRDNIISCIKTSATKQQQQQGQQQQNGNSLSQWHLFNDFSVTPIFEQEALFMNLDWKLPCLIFYSLCDLNQRHSQEVINPITYQVFCDDVSLAARGQSHMMFTPLDKDEMPESDQIVAMDAEFVTLNQEEAEIRSDGTRSTIRPSHLSVARMSCVRGQGPLEGVPFIDDYISTQEQVVDYLTKFSGIQPGDLDATLSSKHLTTLKATYQKLRLLIDIGVKFVGHGLRNDFRVLNLVVPPKQIVDTVLLFQLPNKRMISLRFLAWHFLGLKIQSETHDSVEDAKTALQLYKKYQELKSKGELKEALKELYDVGRTLQWKVPGTSE